MRTSTHDRGNGSSAGLRHLPQPALRFRTAAVRAAGARLSLPATVNALNPVTPGTLSPRPSRPRRGWPRGSARTCRFRDLGDPSKTATLRNARTSRIESLQFRHHAKGHSGAAVPIGRFSLTADTFKFSQSTPCAPFAEHLGAEHGRTSLGTVNISTRSKKPPKSGWPSTDDPFPPFQHAKDAGRSCSCNADPEHVTVENG